MGAAMTDEELFEAFESIANLGLSNEKDRKRCMALIAKFRTSINEADSKEVFRRLMTTGVHRSLNADAFLWASSPAEMHAAKVELAGWCGDCGAKIP